MLFLSFLVEGIQGFAHNCFVSGEELLSGKWIDNLEGLLAKEYDWPEIAVNGAEVAADKILSVI